MQKLGQIKSPMESKMWHSSMVNAYFVLITFCGIELCTVQNYRTCAYLATESEFSVDVLKMIKNPKWRCNRRISDFQMQHNN